jgi:hypothetical protein
VENWHFIEEFARHDNAVTSIRHVLELIARGELVVSREIVDGLGAALDIALGAYGAFARRVTGTSRGNGRQPRS